MLGYTHVSTANQDVAAQKDRLRQIGAIRVFKNVISGKQFERPGLAQLINHTRAGDSLRVTRLGRSLKELLETVENLKAHGIHLVSLKERIDTTSAARELGYSMSSGRLLTLNSGSFPSARATGLQPPENATGDPAARHWTGKPSRPRKPLSRAG